MDKQEDGNGPREDQGKRRDGEETQRRKEKEGRPVLPVPIHLQISLEGRVHVGKCMRQKTWEKNKSKIGREEKEWNQTGLPGRKDYWEDRVWRTLFKLLSWRTWRLWNQCNRIMPTTRLFFGKEQSEVGLKGSWVITPCTWTDLTRSLALFPDVAG